MAYESLENFYGGSYGPLDPNYGVFTGYRVPLSKMALTTDPRTANVIREVTSKLSQGLKALEVTQLSPEIFEAIPKEHLKEINQLGKLTGADFSLHAPIIDPAGFTREGWNETNREYAERQIKEVIERAHDLDPKGNIPVTFHATGGVPSSEWRVVEGKPERQVLYVVNRETGQIAPMEITPKFFPKEEKRPSPEEELRDINERRWASNRTSIIHSKLLADELIEGGWKRVTVDEWKAAEAEKLKPEELIPEKAQGLAMVKLGQSRYEDVDMQLKHMFDEAMRFAPAEKIEREKVVKILEGARKDWQEAKRIGQENPLLMSMKYNDILNKLAKLPAPQIYVPTEQFALEKSKETIANAALHSFKKFGSNAPVISIENVFPNTVFGRGEELAQLIKASREEFVKKAKQAGISESTARDAAQKLIGATWDTGHIFMLRKYGYTPEMTLEQTRKIAPFVKHVHISDNFGFEHTELPPGMGQVPMKEMLSELEKAGYKGKKIVEVGSWWQHFKVSPMPYLLEAFGSPLYEMQMQPFWNQVQSIYGVPGVYGGGYGLMLPEQHMNIYGAGFAALPTELGGALPGKGKQFAGAPME